MKKTIVVFCILSLIISCILLTGCNDSNSDEDEKYYYFIDASSFQFAYGTDIKEIADYFKKSGKYDETENCFYIEHTLETKSMAYLNKLKYYEEKQDFEMVVTQDYYDSFESSVYNAAFRNSYGVSLYVHYGDTLNMAKYMGVYYAYGLSATSGTEVKSVVKLTFKNMTFDNYKELSVWMPFNLYDVQTQFVTSTNESKAKDHFDKEETAKKCYDLFNRGMGFMDDTLKAINNDYSFSTQIVFKD